MKIQPTREAMEKIARDRPDATDAEKYQHAQAQTLLDAFEDERGRPPASMDELEAFVVARRKHGLRVDQ